MQLQCHRQQREAGEQRCEQHRGQPLLGAARCRVQIPGLPLLLHQMVVVGHQQNGVARRHAEQRNEADHRPQSQRTAGQGDRRHPADQRARQRQQHQQHMPRMTECECQQQHDEHEGGGRVQQQFVLWRRSAPRPLRRSAETRPAAAGPWRRSPCARPRHSRLGRRPWAMPRRSGGAIRPDDRSDCAPTPC